MRFCRFVAVFLLVAFAGMSVGQDNKLAGSVKWAAIDGEPGKLGLWVDGGYAGKLDPLSGQWTFHTGKPLDLKSHVRQFNPPKDVKPIPPAAPIEAKRSSTVRTENFIVVADTQADAEQFAKLAEVYRQQKSAYWLGREMPPWPEPCPLRVSIRESGGSGVTSFEFGRGSHPVEMKIEGNRERLANAILPHEVTHTVLAHHFGRPVPRWADEGASVYSEDDIERAKHDKMIVKQLNSGHGIKLSALFRMKDYPRDGRNIMVLYAEGYSVTRYLCEKIGRPKFLGFVGAGMQNGWDHAAQSIGFANVEDLEKQWIEYLRRGGPRSVTPSECKCGDTCPAIVGNECKCGCRMSRAGPSPGFNYWWVVPGVVGVFVVIEMAKASRRPTVAA